MRASAPAGAAVVVVVDDAPATDAVHWAAREAARRRAPLRIVVPTTAAADERRRRLVDALAAARRTAPDIPVQSVLSDEPLARTAHTASADAPLVVLAGPSTAVDELVTSAHCPLVVVPPGGGEDRRGPVVLAVGPATPDTAVAFAFAQAEARGAGLVAVRTWHHPLVDLGVLTGDRIGHWDTAHAAQRQDLADRLGLAALAHPDVPVRMQAVDDSCADLLASLARRARLLVLGRPARGSVLGRVRPSPALVMARLAPCPVAVVPPTAAPRSTWLPERSVGLADLLS